MRLYLSKGGGGANAPPLPVHLSSLPRPICQPVKQKYARNSSLRINGHIFYSSWGIWPQQMHPANCNKYWTHIFVSKLEEKTVSEILDDIFRDRFCIIYWTTFVSDIGQKNFNIYWTNIILIDIGHLQMYFNLRTRSLLSSADCFYSTCWEYESAEAEKVKLIHLNYTLVQFYFRFRDSCIAFDQHPEFYHW